MIKPYIARAILSPQLLRAKRAIAEFKRKRAGRPHLLTVYLRINDPYSYLLLQVLNHLAQRYEIEYDFRTVLDLPADMYPAPELWEKNAFGDSVFLSELYQDITEAGLSFPKDVPHSDAQRNAKFTAQLLHWELQPGYLENALQLFHAYWQANDTASSALLDPAVVNHAECYQHHLTANQMLLEKQGHYLSAMLHYAGEWYWGLDRLQYLERRLNGLGASQGAKPAVLFDRSHRSFCKVATKQVDQQQAGKSKQSANADKPLELFLSIRSPYSYIGLVRTRQLAEHYGLQLVLKPVLPMIMRRMQVPKNKGMYIVRDVVREAEQHQIPIGLVADPLGKGVENCYAMFEYASSKNKAVEYMESYARGVWAEGIRSDTEQGLEKLVSRAGLDWQQARTYLSDESWRNLVQHNLTELYTNQQWGVPSLKYGKLTVFGQDRIDRIEREIARTL